jgi:sugar lactone lactonase YvrE
VQNDAQTDVKIEIVADVKPVLGEGPVWDVDQQRLYWIDSLGCRVFRCTADGSEFRSWIVPAAIGSMALRASGEGAVVALATGIHLLDFASGDTTPVVDPEPDLPANRLNDGKVDPRGRFVFGSMDTRELEASGALYSLDADLELRRIADGIGISNGPCWSPDGATFYFGDTSTRVISAYDYDLETGSVANRRDFASLPADGVPGCDGSTVDAEGFVWNAEVYGGRLLRYAPDGTLDRVVEMPVKKVTSVAFGGADLDVLFVTSMAKPPLPHHPGDPVLAGSLFAVTRLGVAGLPERRFAG